MLFLRVVEIKYFFKYKDLLLMEVVKSDFDFCLDGKGYLKEIYVYYILI